MFDDGAVLAARRDLGEARGLAQIARLATALNGGGYTYLADPIRVLQARDTALVMAARAVNVMRRGGDHRWRYTISLLDSD